MKPSSAYLTAYNSLSCALWAYLTVRALACAPALYAAGNLHTLYHELLSPLLTGTQTLALVEIVHAATRLVRASPVTTAIQVVGKNLVVWTVMVAFPETVVGADGRGGAAGVWPFVGCVVFWGVSEVVRYGYFVVLLVMGDAPRWLKWLRYVLSLAWGLRKFLGRRCDADVLLWQVQRFHRLVPAWLDQRGVVSVPCLD